MATPVVRVFVGSTEGSTPRADTRSLRHQVGPERLLFLRLTDSSPPQAVTRRSRFRATKPTFADRASDWGWPTGCPVAASSVCERGIDRPDGVLSKACAGTFRHRQQISPSHPLVQPAADRDG